MRPTSTEYDGLEPIEPGDALRLDLDHKATEYSRNTVQARRYRLQYFVEWCEEIGLSNLNDPTCWHVQEYRLWRKEHGDLVQISLNKQMYAVRAFVKPQALTSSSMLLTTAIRTSSLSWQSQVLARNLSINRRFSAKDADSTFERRW